jgi:hypothetical protein
MPLVYAYGCLKPESGLEHAMAESERCAQMWDDLAKLDAAMYQMEVDRACAQHPRLARIHSSIAELTKTLRESPNDKKLRFRRARFYGIARRALNRWRKRNKTVLAEFNKQRVEKVIAIRSAYTVSAAPGERLYWCNSNNVLQHYETGRAVASAKGRRIRERDPRREDGWLAIQVQRTKTGFGMSIQELHSGSFSALQISNPNKRGHAVCEMRVDAAGNLLRFPVIMHRPLPEGARIKGAQVTWREKGGAFVWQLTLILDTDKTNIFNRLREMPADPVTVEFAWQERGYLEVMRVGTKVWRLPPLWMARVDGLEARQGELDALVERGHQLWREHPVMGPLLKIQNWRDRIGKMALARPHLTQDQVLWWVKARRLWLAIPGEREHILRNRLNTYRLWAREVVSSYAGLCLPPLNLAAAAREDQGTDANRWRQRAAVHILRAEILHQARKAGTPVINANARAPKKPSPEGSNSWARRKAGKAEKTAALAKPETTA